MQQQPRDTEASAGANVNVDETPSPSPPPTMPVVPTPVTIHEPRRPIRLLGDDGRVTETLNDSE